MHFCPRVHKILLWKAKARLIQAGLRKKFQQLKQSRSCSTGTIPKVPVTGSFSSFAVLGQENELDSKITE